MKFDISIHGRGGHGSRPDNSINPIDCFTAVLSAMESLGRCEITRVDGGTASNIIPNTVRFQGALENADANCVKAMVDSCCQAYACHAEYHMLNK